jgi:hypothetical protein
MRPPVQLKMGLLHFPHPLGLVCEQLGHLTAGLGCNARSIDAVCAGPANTAPFAKQYL